MIKTKYWFDTEFIEDGETIDLISIGMVCEDGRELYLENLAADLTKAGDWVKENVIPHLWSRPSSDENRGMETLRYANKWSRDGGVGGLMSSPSTIAAEILKFVNAGDNAPEFWAYYADYDWVVLCQLFGTMLDLPKSWPMFCLDIKQAAYLLGDPFLPEQSSTEHNALFDARWNRQVYYHLEHVSDDRKSNGNKVIEQRMFDPTNGPKMLRETLCVAQCAIGQTTTDQNRQSEHRRRIQVLIDICDQHRPLGPNGKHGNLHTPTCGCEDK